LVYTLTTDVGNGELRLSGTLLAASDTFTQEDVDLGRVTYDHNGSQTTSDLFLFSVTDGTTTLNDQFDFAVTPVSDAVNAIADNYEVDEDSQLLADSATGLLSNDSYQGSQNVIVFEASNTSNGSVSVDQDGSFVYSPQNGFKGQDSFSYVMGETHSALTNYFGLDPNHNDLVGGATATYVGASSTAGVVGNGVQFDETDDYVLLEDVTLSNNLTISFEFKVDDLSGTGHQYLLSRGGLRDVDSLNIYMGEAFGVSSNLLRTVVSDGAIGDLDVNVGTLNLDDGNWHTYTLVIEDGVGAKVFINGALEASGSAASISGGGDIYLGSRSDQSASRFYSGALDSVRVFDQALSDSEAATVGSNLSVATVTIDVNEIAHDDVYGVESGGTLVVPVGESLLYNDFDKPGLSVSVLTNPSEGSVVVNATDGTFRYTHAGTSSSTDSFVYEVSDGTDTWTATAFIEIDESGLIDSGEFLVNANEGGGTPEAELQDTHLTAGLFSQSAVAAAENGDYAVVWTGTDGTSEQVYMRLFDSSGTAISDAMQVSNQVGINHAASVAMSASGEFVVVWENEFDSASDDGTPNSIYFQRFNDDGTRNGSAQAVTTDGSFTSGSQIAPSIAMNASGSFAIAWEGEGPSTSGGGFVNVFDNAGNSISGGPMDIDYPGGNVGDDVMVAIGDDGTVVAAMNDNHGIEFRVFEKQGDGSYDGSLGESFVLGQRFHSTKNVSLAITPDSSSLVLAYEGQLLDGGDWDARVQVVSLSNIDTIYGADTIVAGDQYSPSVDIGHDGIVVVTWSGNGTGDSDGVFGRKFKIETGSTGDQYLQAVSEVFSINETTSGVQEGASVSVIDGSNFVVVWNGEGVGDSDGVFARNFGNQSGYAVTGRVVEDVDGNSRLDDAVGVTGAKVRLYHDTNGDGLKDSNDRIVREFTTTDSLGSYSFDGLKSGETYWVTVDSKTITASTGHHGSSDDAWAEQTYGDGGVKVGGLFAGTSDNFDDLTTSQHVSRIEIADSNYTDVDFGFSFNVVSNVGGGGTEDHDTSDDALPVGSQNERSVQGSLRQFISNANSVVGGNQMRFVPGATTSITDGTDEWWKIAITAALPEITDAYTTIDGRAFDNADIVFDAGDDLDPSRMNSNQAKLGSAALGADGVASTADDGTLTVGTGVDGVDGTGDERTIGELDAPDLEIRDEFGIRDGLVVNAANVEIAYLSINGFGFWEDPENPDAQITVFEGGDNVWIHNNVIGATAHEFSAPATAAFSEHGIVVWLADDGVIENNLISFNEHGGVRFIGNSNGSNFVERWIIQGNEIGDNTSADTLRDGITLNMARDIDILGNYIKGNYGGGIDLWNSPGNVRITSNTISGNGVGPDQQFGVRLFGDDNSVLNNVIKANTGPGVLVAGEYNDGTYAFDASTGNLISKNSFSANTGIAIDLLSPTGDLNTLHNGEGVSDNATAADVNAGNDGLDHPNLTSLYVDSSGDLYVDAQLPTANLIDYLEVYVASSDAGDASGGENYGEGTVYLGRIDVTAANFDSATGEFTGLLAEPAGGWAQDPILGEDITVIGIDSDTNNTTEFSNTRNVHEVVEAVDSSVAGVEDTEYFFTLTDFQLADPLNPVLDKIVIDSLPANGTLFLSGSAIGELDLPLDVTALQLSAGELSYLGDLNSFSSSTDTASPEYHVDSFGFKVHNGIELSLNVSQLGIHLAAVNDAPTITTTDFSSDENSMDVVGVVAANDVENDSITFALAADSATNDNSLFVLDSSSGELNWVASADFESELDWNSDGVYTVDVIAGDGKETSTSTLTVQVNDLNESTIVADDEYWVDEGDVFVQNVLSNDFDPEGNALTVQIVSGGQHGEATVVGGQLRYQHDGSESTADKITYVVSDGTNVSEEATVIVNVLPIQDATVAKNDVFFSTSATVVTIEQEEILQNDIDPDSSISEMGLVIVTQSSEGFAEIIDGKLVFTPNSTFDGSTNLQYAVEANGLVGNVATISINAQAAIIPATEEAEEAEEAEEETTETEEELQGSTTSQPTDSGEQGSVGTTGFGSSGNDVNPFGSKVSAIQSFDSDASTNDLEFDLSDPTYALDRKEDVEVNLIGLVVSTKVVELSEFESTLFAGLLWDDLDSAKEDFLMNRGFEIGMPAIAASAASFLTVGYVAWIIRGGVLLTTFVSSIPAWSSFDIQSIIEAASEGESIEQMVDHK
jgi:parallel beta-helix repeat protein